MLPVLHVGSLALGTYGLLVTLGYLVVTVWLRRNRWEMRAPARKFWQLGFCIVTGGLIGAKLGFMLVERKEFLADPGFYLRHWKIGWVFWPGILLGTAMGFLYQWVHNRRHRPRAFLAVADYFGACLPLAHAFGRLGCFAEGCCHGRPTDLPWGVRFSDPACSVGPKWLGVPLHPVQLYEAAGLLAICLLNMLYVLPEIRRKRLRYGTAFLGYVFLYSVLRFLLEFLRGDSRGQLLWPLLSPSQWISLATLAAAGWLLRRRGLREPDPEGRSIWLPRGRVLGL